MDGSEVPEALDEACTDPPSGGDYSPVQPADKGVRPPLTLGLARHAAPLDVVAQAGVQRGFIDAQLGQ